MILFEHTALLSFEHPMRIDFCEIEQSDRELELSQTLGAEQRDKQQLVVAAH